jgi:hypothetical protein
LAHHPVFRNLDIKSCKHKGRFCGHFSRVVVSDFRSLRGDIVSEALSARQSRAAKIPFLAVRRDTLAAWARSRDGDLGELVVGDLIACTY